MLAFKTDLKKAESSKKKLISIGIYDFSREIKKTEKYIFLPVKKKDIRIKGIFVHTKLDKIQRHYDYKELLIKSLSKEEFRKLPHSFDIIGDILIIHLPKELYCHEKKIGEALLKTHKGIKSVFKRVGIHSGEYRTQTLNFIAGEKRKETICRENNVRIKLDVEKIYFSPRLSTERKRIYTQVREKERILVMFSGSGIYPIVISRNTGASKIIGIEKNPVAHKYAYENLKLNKIKNVELINSDVREAIPLLKEKFDRIVMPLPKGGESFLELIPEVSHSRTIVHFYDFEHETEFEKAEQKVRKAFPKSKILKVVKCGQYSPGKFRVCVDFIIGVHARQLLP